MSSTTFLSCTPLPDFGRSREGKSPPSDLDQQARVSVLLGISDWEQYHSMRF